MNIIEETDGCSVQLTRVPIQRKMKTGVWRGRYLRFYESKAEPMQKNRSTALGYFPFGVEMNI